MTASASYQKNPRIRKIFVCNSGAGNGCVNFMDAWQKCVLSPGKTHVHKIPRFGGGVLGVFLRGGVPILFFWARGFSEATKQIEQIRRLENWRSLVAQALHPPYRAVGSRYTLPLFVFQVHHPIALHPPPHTDPYRIDVCLHAKQNLGGGYSTSSCPLKGIAL